MSATTSTHHALQLLCCHLASQRRHVHVGEGHLVELSARLSHNAPKGRLLCWLEIKLAEIVELAVTHHMLAHTGGHFIGGAHVVGTAVTHLLKRSTMTSTLAVTG